MIQSLKALVPLCGDVNALDIMNVIKESDSQAVVRINETGSYYLEYVDLKLLNQQ